MEDVHLGEYLGEGGGDIALVKFGFKGLDGNESGNRKRVEISVDFDVTALLEGPDVIVWNEHGITAVMRLTDS